MKVCQGCGKPYDSQGVKYCSRQCSGKASMAIAREKSLRLDSLTPGIRLERSRKKWQDSEYAKRVRSKTLDDPDWCKKYQSQDNIEYAHDGYRRKLETDPEFADHEREKRLLAGWKGQSERDTEGFASRIANQNRCRLWTKEGLDKLSKHAIRQNHDQDSKFGTRRYKYVEYKGIKFRSSWELELAQELDTLDILWIYEAATFTLDDSRRYTPDFYLPEYKLFVEVKPEIWVDEIAKNRLDQTQSISKESTVMVTEYNWEIFLNYLLEVRSQRSELR